MPRSSMVGYMEQVDRASTVDEYSSFLGCRYSANENPPKPGDGDGLVVTSQEYIRGLGRALLLSLRSTECASLGLVEVRRYLAFTFSIILLLSFLNERSSRFR